MLPFIIPTEAGGASAFLPRASATAQGRTDGENAFEAVMSDEQASAAEPSIPPTTAESIAREPRTSEQYVSGPTLTPKVAPETSVSATEGMTPSDKIEDAASGGDRPEAGGATAKPGAPAGQTPLPGTPPTPLGDFGETGRPGGTADERLRSDASAPLRGAQGGIDDPVRGGSTPQGDGRGSPAAPNSTVAARPAGETAEGSASPGPAFPSDPRNETKPKRLPTGDGEGPRPSSALSRPGDSGRVAGNVGSAEAPGMMGAIGSEEGRSFPGEGSLRVADATTKPADGQGGGAGNAGPRTERTEPGAQARAVADPARFQAATGLGGEVAAAVSPTARRPTLPAADYAVSVRTVDRAVPQDAPPVVAGPRPDTPVTTSLRPEIVVGPTSGAAGRAGSLPPGGSAATAAETPVPTVAPQAGPIPPPTLQGGDGADVATPNFVAAAAQASPAPVALHGIVAAKSAPVRAVPTSSATDQIARPATGHFSDRPQRDLRAPTPGQAGAAVFGQPVSSGKTELAIAPIVVETALGTAAPDQVSDLALTSPETQTRTPTAAFPTPPAAQDLPRAQAIVQQIADAARLGPEGQIEVTLSPEELGRVRLTMSPADAGLAVLVQADREETLELLRRHIDILARDLSDQGYGALNFSFGHTGQGSGERQGDADAATILDVPRSDGLGSFDGREDPRPSGVTASGHLDLRL